MREFGRNSGRGQGGGPQRRRGGVRPGRGCGFALKSAGHGGGDPCPSGAGLLGDLLRDGALAKRREGRRDDRMTRRRAIAPCVSSSRHPVVLLSSARRRIQERPGIARPPSDCLPQGTPRFVWNLGGAKEGRTPDLLNAIQTLYQLSYSPMCRGRGGNLAKSPFEVKRKMREKFLFFRVDPKESPVVLFAPVETPVRAHGPPPFPLPVASNAT